jgi:hypothetical protein
VTYEGTYKNSYRTGLKPHVKKPIRRLRSRKEHGSEKNTMSAGVSYARFVFPEMKVQVVVFLVVAQCSVASTYTIKMDAARSSKTMVSYHITPQCHNPEDHDFSGINLKKGSLRL